MGMINTETRPSGDSIYQFWLDWHELRKCSGRSIPDLARQMHSNKTTLYELGKSGSRTNQFRGSEFVATALTAVGVPVEEHDVWQRRYAALDEARRKSAEPRTLSWTAFWATLVSSVVTTGICSVWVTVVVTSRPVAPPVAGSAAGPAVIEVSNKVALGKDALMEDETPAYLSRQPIRRCASQQKRCKIVGTDMASGALLVATCQTTGDELVNYNLDSAADSNPYRVKSARWYGVKLPDGRFGYISEVYIDARNRGGLALPPCKP